MCSVSWFNHLPWKKSKILVQPSLYLSSFLFTRNFILKIDFKNLIPLLPAGRSNTDLFYELFPSPLFCMYRCRCGFISIWGYGIRMGASRNMSAIHGALSIILITLWCKGHSLHAMQKLQISCSLLAHALFLQVALWLQVAHPCCEALEWKGNIQTSSWRPSINRN